MKTKKNTENEVNKKEEKEKKVSLGHLVKYSMTKYNGKHYKAGDTVFSEHVLNPEHFTLIK